MKNFKLISLVVASALLLKLTSGGVSAHGRPDDHSGCTKECVDWKKVCKQWKHSKCVKWEKVCEEYKWNCPKPTVKPTHSPCPTKTPTPTSTPTPTPVVTPVVTPTPVIEVTPTPNPTLVPTPETTPAPTGAPQPCNGCNNTPSAPVCTAAKPPAPVLISVDRKGESAEITWSTVTPATHYTISYGTDPGVYIYGVPNTGNTNHFTVHGLQTGTKYYFSVNAVNDCMPGDPSISGQVLGASTIGSVKGLAYTGGPWLEMVLILTGATIFPFSFKKASKKI